MNKRHYRASERLGNVEEKPASRWQKKMSSIEHEMKKRYHLRVRKWRTEMSGCAWRVTAVDGKRTNWIEAPRPRSPVSLAVFLHEVGHHSIGFYSYKRRCVEEYRAWNWALIAMEARGVKPTSAVKHRVYESMERAVRLARAHGMKEVPKALEVFTPLGEV